MNNWWSSSLKKSRTKNKIPAALLLAAALLGGQAGAFASVPPWLREAARAPLPTYPGDTDAVALLDEQVTTANVGGEIKTLHRLAYKILRPQGREYGTVVVYFDSETRLTFLKAWSLTAEGKEYEVKEKEAAEASYPGGGALYADTHYKFLRIPAADPGNVVGYEYEQKGRPYILQGSWHFQHDIPVRQVRFVLQLPRGWEYETFWLNHPPQKPQSVGENQWVWELHDIPAISHEEAMPAWRALAGRMAVTYFSPGTLAGGGRASWQAIGQWYGRLAADRRQLTPEIRQKALEITSHAATPLEKIQALSEFVQRDIRYVAIVIGIGGFQPHPAQEIFSNRYGDCKDKVTLLSTMLSAIGVESYYVLIHTDRGVVAPTCPTALTFNHVILAIRLPKEVSTEGLFAIRENKQLGKLLFFDPTDHLTPLGYLPSELQANYGLVVREGAGELVELPLLAPTLNRIIRSSKFALSSTGTIQADVQEIRWGTLAASKRAELQGVPEPQRRKIMEDFLGLFLGSVVLQSSEVQNLDQSGQNLILHYRFLARDYAKVAGDLLLVRPRILGRKSSDLLQKKDRKNPVEFPDASLQSDLVEIVLPEGYSVDELPPPVEASCGFAEYKSESEVAGNVLRYKRNYTIKDVHVPIELLDELKKFYRQVSADERSSAVLKRTAPVSPPSSGPASKPSQ